MHTRADQSYIFSLMGHSQDAQHERFGAILDALEYGAPPHGGIAMGIDRWVMFAAGEENIREVMAFPKNQRGVDLMFEAPSPSRSSSLSMSGLRCGRNQANLIRLRANSLWRAGDCAPPAAHSRELFLHPR